LRIEYPGAVYHVTARGDARKAIFRDDGDRRAFLQTLAQLVERFGWVCHAYCLMNNHYHLLLETPQANLSRGMRQLNGIYSQAFNRRHRRVGHVLQGRFKSILVDRESYLLELARYVVLNPVRAKTVRRPADYPWSSYRATAGLCGAPPCLTRDWLLYQFGRDRDEAAKRYRQFIAERPDRPKPWGDVIGQLFLGPEPFVRKMANRLKKVATNRDFPLRQRLAARPALKALFHGKASRDKTARNRAIRRAHIEHGYTLSEIGAHLDLHYATISRIVNQEQTP
jgi:REP element-mobilizing transposase RayT